MVLSKIFLFGRNVSTASHLAPTSSKDPRSTTLARVAPFTRGGAAVPHASAGSSISAR
jgi:hypothetical protein